MLQMFDGGSAAPPHSWGIPDISRVFPTSKTVKRQTSILVLGSCHFKSSTSDKSRPSRDMRSASTPPPS